MDSKFQFPLRIPKEMADRLKEAAAREKRSVNNLLEVIIDEYLKKHESEQ